MQLKTTWNILGKLTAYNLGTVIHFIFLCYILIGRNLHHKKIEVDFQFQPYLEVGFWVHPPPPPLTLPATKNITYL